MAAIHGIDILSTLDELVHPQHTALLIYDMQVGIARQVPGAEAVVARVQTLVSATRTAGMWIAYSRHLSAPCSWMGVSQMRMAMAWQRISDPQQVKPWFPRGAEATEIVPDLAPQPDDLFFDKLAMSAFEGTFLEFALRDAGVTGLAVAGIALEVGIEPTLRHAADLGFIPILVEDACGHGNAEAAARSVEALRFAGDTIVTTVSDFCGALAG